MSLIAESHESAYESAGFIETMRRGEIALGAGINFTDPTVTECLCGLLDFVWIDMEHGPLSLESVMGHVMATKDSSTTPIVRVPWNEPVIIKRVLDLGAAGIIAPMVCTADEAQQLTAACRYPPDGTRSFGPTRAMAYGLDPSYAQRANHEVIFMPIIETAEAGQHIEEILAVVGLDTYIVGPVDLAMSLGVPDQFDHPRFTAAFDRVEQAAARADLPRCRTLMNEEATAEHLQSLIDAGYSCFWVDGDEWMLASVCRRVADQFNRIRPKQGD